MDEDGPSSIAVTVGTAGWRTALADLEVLCQTAVAAALMETAAGAWLAVAEVSLLLSDDRTVRRLNAAYRGHDRPTNVLSFPALELTPGRWPLEPPAGTPFLGDIVLAEETVRREAERENKPLAAHLSHLLVHGTLHLLGYQHDEDEGAAAMEELERRILARLGLPDPYGHDDRETLEAKP